MCPDMELCLFCAEPYVQTWNYAKKALFLAKPVGVVVGELDPSTPRASGVLWLVVFEG